MNNTNANKNCSICRAPTDLNDTCGMSECQEAAYARSVAACAKPGSARRDKLLRESAALARIARDARCRRDERAPNCAACGNPKERRATSVASFYVCTNMECESTMGVSL